MQKIHQTQHKVRTEFSQATGMPKVFIWTNELGEQDAPGDLPSEMRFNDQGVLVCAFWRRNGKLDRPGDLPAKIYYDPISGKAEHFQWHKCDVLHRESDRPARIWLDSVTGKVTRVDFSKNGTPFRKSGGATHISFDDDGIACDSDGEPIEFEALDDQWLPRDVKPSLF